MKRGATVSIADLAYLAAQNCNLEKGANEKYIDQHP